MDTIGVSCDNMLNDEYEGVVQNYRLGLKTQRTGECLIKVSKLDPSMVGSIVGWYVIWPFKKPKLMGRIISLHGRTGTLRVKFRRGLPGQALGSRVKIVSKRKQLEKDQTLEADTGKPESPKVQILEITDIKGVGKATEERLRKAGFDTVESIASVDAETISKRTGMSSKVAAKIIASAKDLLNNM